MSLKRVKYIVGMVAILSGFLLSACDKDVEKHEPKGHVITAKLETPVESLYYSSALAPILTVPVVTPVAGNVEKIFFTYGEKIHKDEKLLVLSSSPLAQDYRKTVSDFLQKKQSFITNKLSFEGTEALYKAGVVTQNQYTTEKSQFDNAALAFLQARYRLEKVLTTANINAAEIEELSISDTQKVNEILQRRFRNIIITAPIGGIALYPSSGSDSDSKQLTVGQTIKDNQMLVLIGNLTGLSAQISVSEVDIDRILKNMDVKVTSNAFPSIVLHGYVSSVSSQAAQNNSGGGLSMFLVTINIPKLSEEAMKKIRVGMTAKFQIDIKMKKAIMLPINAVFQKDNQSFVTVVDKKGIRKNVPVITGTTTPSQVVVTSGIKPGDQVVVYD